MATFLRLNFARPWNGWKSKWEKLSFCRCFAGSTLTKMVRFVSRSLWRWWPQMQTSNIFFFNFVKIFQLCFFHSVICCIRISIVFNFFLLFILRDIIIVYSCCLIIIHLYMFCIKNIVSQISMLLPSRRHLKIFVDVLPCLLRSIKITSDVNSHK